MFINAIIQKKKPVYAPKKFRLINYICHAALNIIIFIDFVRLAEFTDQQFAG